MLRLRSMFARSARFKSTLCNSVTDMSSPIPYGLSNWRQFRHKQYAYIDRTEAIAKIDATTVHSCLWSPRRTGKSLLCNQLALWHDMAITETERKELFAGTFIGENPSPEAGKYLVLYLDFSKVDDRDVPGTFTKVMNAALSEFSEKYVEKGLLKRPVVIDSTDCMSSLSNTTSAVRMSGQKVSLIVDEVDSFANRLLVQVSRKMGLDNSGYNEFVKQEGSVLRQFGRVVKSESNTCIEKMFFTGVMPVAWSDAFSSLNTVKDLTHTKAFEDTLGFKTSDISKLMGQLFPKMTVEESRKHLESIKAKCNGYRRSSTQVEGLYNPQGVWYYMEQLRDKGDQMVPRMDPNIVQPARDEVAAFLVKHAAAAKTYSPVHFFHGVIPFSPLQRFSAQFLFDHVRAPDALLSMAHYCGYLSYAHQKDEVYGDCLVAPNDGMKEVFMDAVLESLPAEYKNLALECLSRNVSRAVVLKEVWEAHLTGDLSGVSERLAVLVNKK